MTNQDDVFGELAAARAYITRGKTDDAIGCIDQALKLITAEFNALMSEVTDAQRAYHAATSDRENARIRDANHNQRVAWTDRRPQ